MQSILEGYHSSNSGAANRGMLHACHETASSLVAEEEERPFVKAMKKVWESVKVFFRQIGQFFADLWHSLFSNSSLLNSKEISAPKSEEEFEKIAWTVEQILSGDSAQFTDANTPNVWEIPCALYPDVLLLLAKKGFDKTQLKTASHVSEEGINKFSVFFDPSKMTDFEIVGLAVEKLKRGKEVYFHYWHGLEGGYLFLLKHVDAVEKKLQREGYAAFSEKHYDYCSDLIFDAENGGYLEGITLIAKKAS